MLFPQDNIKLNLPDADISYYPNIFSKEASLYYYNTLLKDINWKEDAITVFGKTYPQPRLTALLAENERPYKYSSITMYPEVFSETVLNIKQKVEAISKTSFTSCLLNLYRNGQDSNGWHADNEKELGQNPIIASVSFGATRAFNLKHRQDKTLKHKLLLEPGSLLLMQGETQQHWLHQIAKTKREVKPRINLTFRIIK